LLPSDFPLRSRTGLWVVVLFTLAHGIVVPVNKELAWRGIVQSVLVRAEGVTTGIVITAVLHTAKHALVDVSLAPVPTVLVLALVLGVVRHRWGTTASTVVHLVVNLSSVGLLAVYVLGQSLERVSGDVSNGVE
jgi:membrane protease YdiL (CAAX protease family)